jgi:hypothetical protein
MHHLEKPFGAQKNTLFFFLLGFNSVRPSPSQCVTGESAEKDKLRRSVTENMNERTKQMSTRWVIQTKHGLLLRISRDTHTPEQRCIFRYESCAAENHDYISMYGITSATFPFVTLSHVTRDLYDLSRCHNFSI